MRTMDAWGRAAVAVAELVGAQEVMYGRFDDEPANVVNIPTTTVDIQYRYDNNLERSRFAVPSRI